MNTGRVLCHLIWADFLERVRRYSFLVVLGLTVLVGYLMVPPLDAGYTTLDLGECRGVYNSAWIGSMVALAATVMMSLFGFYLVKNALDRDEHTGVGQILAATPLSRPVYMLGKWLSNAAVLAVIIMVIAVVALGMNFVRAEERQIDMWALWSPFLVTVLPVMIFVSGLAMFFESLPILRGGIGNVVYFGLWMWRGLLAPAFLLDAMDEQLLAATSLAPIDDVLGIFTYFYFMQKAGGEVFPGTCTGFRLIYNFPDEMKVFRWSGIPWTGEVVLGRLLWVAIGFGLVMVAALVFHRFDSASVLYPGSGSTNGRTPGAIMAWLKRRFVPDLTPLTDSKEMGLVGSVRLKSLKTSTLRPRFGETLLAELRLMLKGQPWWWYLIAFGLVAVSLVSSVREASLTWLPLAWAWPLLVWSAMGMREARHHTTQIVFSAAYPLSRQLPVAWLAGVAVAILMGSGALIRFLLAGAWGSVLAWMIGALFIPSLALACGIWSSSSKLFEVIYAILWYLGAMNRIYALDFMGAHIEAIKVGMHWRYLGFTIILVVAAIIGRGRQLRMQ